MGSRAFNTAVVLVWIGAMSWLLFTKVLPTLQVGEPPNYTAILSERSNHPPVCWAIRWNDQPIGFAASIVVDRPDDMSEIHSRVFFSQLPLDEMAPGWLGALVRPVLSNLGGLDMDAQSRLEIDPLDHVTGFESRVRLGSIPEAIRLNGTIDGSLLKLSFHSGDLSYRTEVRLPPDALVGDELSPQAYLPGLKVGQRWTMPVYSPFRQPKNPIDILQATVEREDSIVWNGRSLPTLLVVYRNEAGSGLLSSQDQRGRLWVRQSDGLVLKQEVTVFNSKLNFVRLTRSDGKNLVRLLTDALGGEWNGDLSTARAQKIWAELSAKDAGPLLQKKESADAPDVPAKRDQDSE